MSEEIPLLEYFRQKHGRLTTHDLMDIAGVILTTQEPDRLAALACHLVSLLGSPLVAVGGTLALERAWEQRADCNCEKNWEIRRIAWEARIQLERQRTAVQVTPPAVTLTQSVCQSIRWDPQPKVLAAVVDYPLLPVSRPGSAASDPRFQMTLECVRQAWESRLGADRPEDESGRWILQRGLETIRQKQAVLRNAGDTHSSE